MVNHLLNKSSWIWCCLLLVTGLQAQTHQDITFDAKVSRMRLLANSTVEYEVTLRNAQGTEFTPPSFKGFTVLSGPGRKVGSSLINGVQSSYMSFSWLLQPNQPGQLTIEPASIRALNRIYRSNSLRIEVLPVDADLAGLAPDNFIRLELNADSVYVGQQVIMNLQLYSTDNVVSRNIASEPNLDDFFAFPRRQFDVNTQTVIENGKEYLRRNIASVALYPLKSGTLNLEPFRMLLGVIRYRNPQSSFSRRYTERIPLQTDSVALWVSELPQPRPDNFSGGVGKYTLKVNANRQELSTDDAITVRLSISGEGDVKRITTPTPVDEKDWVIYDPEVLTEEFYDGPNGIYGQKVFEYKIVPRRAGNYSLTPSINYFDVDSNAYVDLAALSYDVSVSQGSGSPIYEEDEVVDSTASLSLRPIGTIDNLRNYHQSPLGGGLLLSLAILPLLVLGGLFFYDYRQRSLAALDPAERARAKAAKLANRHLQQAKEALKQGQPEAFYDAIEDALLGYLRDKLQLPVAALAKRNIEQQLLDHGSTPTLATAYVELLKRCEMALYAGQTQAADLNAVYEKARDLILQTEKV